MKGRSLAVLAALVAVLGAFVWFFERDLPSTDERKEREKKVLPVEASDVRALEIAWDDNVVRLERAAASAEEGDDEESDADEAAPGEWQLTSPLEARADAAAVDGLLTRLVGLEKERTLEDVSPADVGLDAPEVRVRLEHDAGADVLLFGTEVPASSDRILGVEGRADAYQVAGGLVADLEKEPGEWRDRDLFSAARKDVQQIRLSRSDADGDVLLVRRGDDFWIESPFSDRADGDLANGLLNRLTGLRAERFVDAEAGEGVAWEAPQGEVEVVLADGGAPFRLELGAATESGALQARVGAQTVEITSGLDQDVDRSPEAWRSRELTSLQSYRVDRATVHGDDGFTLRRADAEWLRDEERIDYATASDLLYAISDAKADSVVPAGALELTPYDVEGPPTLRIELATEDEEPQELRFFSGFEGRWAVNPSDREVFLLLPADAADSVLDAVDAVSAAEPVVDDDAALAEVEEDAED